MFNLFDIPLIGLDWLILGFSSPKIAAPAPLPPAPTEDPLQAAERERQRSQAVVDLAQSGRRSTMSAGKSLTDEQFLGQVGSKRKRMTAADELGAM